MIATKLMGGLGNQMFQYAAGRSLAERVGTELLLDLSWFKDTQQPGDTTRQYDLHVYRLNAEAVNRVLPHGRLGHLKNLTNRISGRSYQILKEHGHQFNNAFLQAGNQTYLEGFWQSERYFCDIADQIRSEFKPKAPLDSKNQKIADSISKGQAISVHIRRGDYVSNPNASKFHGIMGLDYYRKAIDLVAGKIKNPRFLIFSDDPEWSQQNLDLSFETSFVSHNSGPESYKDIDLMRRCSHHIIANSSFSWWGAWLNPNKDKIVVGPKQWFKDSSVDTSDVLPSDWIKL